MAAELEVARPPGMTLRHTVYRGVAAVGPPTDLGALGSLRSLVTVLVHREER